MYGCCCVTDPEGPFCPECLSATVYGSLTTNHDRCSRRKRD